MTLFIKLARDKSTNKPLTNVEICKRMYEKFLELKNKYNGLDKLHEYYRLFGGSQNENDVMKFLEEINNTADYNTAQKLIANNILPIK